MDKMNIIYKGLDEIEPYKNNPRSNDKAVEAVAESIDSFGFKVPLVVDKDGVIVTGHTRFKAAQMLGLEEVPTIVADDLSEEKLKAYRIADNKVAEASTWNKDLLKIELENLDDIFTGFDDAELDKLFEDQNIDKKPEVEFTEELGEESNYLVLYFDNTVDWLQAQSVFDLKTVKALDSKPGFEKKGVGRVINGTEFINKMME